MSHSTPVRACVYLRCSKDEQIDSFDRQREQITPYALRNGYELVKTYEDFGISGTDVKRRKGFLQMIADAQKGLWDCILLDHKDRIGRFDSFDQGYYFKPLRDLGIWLESVANGRIDWNSFAGRIADAVTQEAANLEVKNTSRRISTSFQMLAQRGDWLGGPVPYAWRVEDKPGKPDGWRKRWPKTLVHGDPRHVQVVQLLFKTYADNVTSMRSLVDVLHERGVPSPTGREWWPPETLRELLMNPIYAGDYLYAEESGSSFRTGMSHTRVTRKGVEESGTRFRHQRNPKDEWIVITDHYPAMVDRDTFSKVQLRLAENQRNKAPTRVKGTHVLSDILVCGHCRGNMGAMVQKGNNGYRCLNAHRNKSLCVWKFVREDILLDVIVRKLREEFLNPEGLALLRQELRQELEEQQRSGVVDGMRKEIETLEGYIASGNRNLVILPPDRLPGVIATIKEYEDKRDRLRAEVARIEGESKVQELEAAIERVECLLWDLDEAIRGGSPPRIRALMRDVIDHVVLRFRHYKVGKSNRSELIGGTIYLAPEDEGAELTFGTSSHSTTTHRRC